MRLALVALVTVSICKDEMLTGVPASVSWMRTLLLTSPVEDSVHSKMCPSDVATLNIHKRRCINSILKF